MNYCKLCCQPDTRPKIVFKDGVCGACLYQESKKEIDWDARTRELWQIVDWAKGEAKKRNTYDCICGVSGGKDSTFATLYARDKLGLNVLLLNIAPEVITPIGRHNIDNLIGLGFDCITVVVNPEVQKKLMKRDFFKYLQLRISTELPIHATTYIMAKKLNIPLVINGENPTMTLGVYSDHTQDSDASKIMGVNTVKGRERPWEEYADLIEAGEITKEDLYFYTFPTDIEDWDGRGVWIQYYAPEWSQNKNALLARAYGLQFRDDDMENLGRIHPWSCMDSDFHPVNQLLKYAKFGFGFATDEVCYDIRDGLLSREDGFKLIEKFDGLCGAKYLNAFCQWLDIGINDFWATVKKFAKYKRREWPI